MALNVEKELREVQEVYEDISGMVRYNALVYGDSGTGKTWSLRTARKPVLMDVFDPGGETTLRRLLDGHEGIFADTRWQQEDASHPSAYADWESTFERRRRGDLFEGIGTYCIDSLTTWAEALMNYIQKEEGSLGDTPRQRDYLIQMRTIRDVIKVCTGLPCDFIITGHVHMVKDDVSGRTLSAPLITGKLSQRIGILFDEMYYAEAKNTREGTNYQWLTKNDGSHIAKSRLASEEEIPTHADQDFKKILRAAGLDDNDLPIPDVGEGETTANSEPATD